MEAQVVRAREERGNLCWTDNAGEKVERMTKAEVCGTQ